MNSSAFTPTFVYPFDAQSLSSAAPSDTSSESGAISEPIASTSSHYNNSSGSSSSTNPNLLSSSLFYAKSAATKHSMAEHMRRKQIKTGFDRLQNLLPEPMRSQKLTKSMILEKSSNLLEMAVQRIQHLEMEVDMLKHEKQSLISLSGKRSFSHAESELPQGKRAKPAM